MRSDFELLDAWRDGDEVAGGVLFERHFDAAFRFFRNKVGDEAGDLVQQTFLECTRSRQRFRKASSFRTYLFVVARSKLYDHLRARRRDEKVFSFDVVSVEDLGVSPSRLAIQQEEHKLLLHALRRLPVELQVILELYYVEHVRGEMLCEVLELPSGTVRSRIRRGIEQLRKIMSELEASPERVATTMTNLDRWAAALRESVPHPGRA